MLSDDTPHLKHPDINVVSLLASPENMGILGKWIGARIWVGPVKPQLSWNILATCEGLPAKKLGFGSAVGLGGRAPE